METCECVASATVSAAETGRGEWPVLAELCEEAYRCLATRVSCTGEGGLRERSAALLRRLSAMAAMDLAGLPAILQSMRSGAAVAHEPSASNAVAPEATLALTLPDVFTAIFRDAGAEARKEKEDAATRMKKEGDDEGDSSGKMVVDAARAPAEREGPSEPEPVRQQDPAAATTTASARRQARGREGEEKRRDAPGAMAVPRSAVATKASDLSDSDEDSLSLDSGMGD